MIRLTPDEDYFCPKCNYKMTLDMVASLKADGIPPMLVVNMALHILSDACCPTNILKSLSEWAKTYGGNLNEFSEEEQDKLRLVKWKAWATK